MTVDVKICGLKTEETVRAALDAGAAYLGFVFYPPSPRAISAEVAGGLSRFVPPQVKKVALTVDASDEELEIIIRTAKPDILQAHGSESVQRVTAIKKRFSLPVMKAVAVSRPADIESAQAYVKSADYILFDARPAHDALPGGNGESFDWTLLNDLSLDIPWFLSGGLTSLNVAQALRTSHADKVDVSSGVERRRGEKDPALIAAFIRAAKQAQSGRAA